MVDLSVIVPFCNEYPQVEFTAQSILNELRGSGIDFELMMVDNWCKQAADQMEDCRICGARHKRVMDRSGGNIYGLSLKANPEMHYLHYDAKLSHWQAKNMGVRASTGRVLWFCDAHCSVVPGSLQAMYRRYVRDMDTLNGTLHFPISYMLDRRKLLYKIAGSLSKREFHYSFTAYREPSGDPFRVPAMSTCGMMMSRDIYDRLGGWPEELGIYGGGENFVNFTMATLGLNVNIMPGPPLFHYAERRGYHWNFDDYLRNRMIATFIFGGPEMLRVFTQHSKGGDEAKRKIEADVLSKQSLQNQRAYIEGQQKVDIVEWWRSWGGP